MPRPLGYEKRDPKSRRHAGSPPSFGCNAVNQLPQSPAHSGSAYSPSSGGRCGIAREEMKDCVGAQRREAVQNCLVKNWRVFLIC